DIPPFGGEIDYLTFGGIYRDVALRVVAGTYIDNIFAKPVAVLSNDRRIDVRCFLNGQSARPTPLKLTIELHDGARLIATESREVSPADAPHYDVTLNNLGAIELWDLDRPKLYQVRAELCAGADCLDHFDTRIG